VAEELVLKFSCQLWFGEACSRILKMLCLFKARGDALELVNMDKKRIIAGYYANIITLDLVEFWHP
jgi:hypothetical protein